MLQQLKDAGFAHVIDFLETYKDVTLGSMLDEIFATPVPSSESFKRILLEQVDDYDLNAQYLKTQIQSYLEHTSTLMCANHAGFENHPMLIASTLLSSVYFAKKGIHALPYCSCSALNPSNATAPTAVFTGQRQKDSLKRRRFRFTPASADKKILYSLKGLNASDYEKIMARIIKSDESCSAALKYICQKCMDLDADANKSKTKLISTLHKFNTINYAAFADKAFDINPVFINQERFVISLLINDLDDDSAFISRLVDNKDYILNIAKNLANKSNTWSDSLCSLDSDTKKALENGHGTVFFYALENDSLKPLKLAANKGQLLLVNETLNLSLDRKSLKQHLQQGSLIPNLYICYASLYFTHNVRTAGGIFMTQYLRDMLSISAKVMHLELKDDYFLGNVISACIMPFVTVQSGSDCRALLLCDMAGSSCQPDFLHSVLDARVGDFTDMTLCEMVYDFTSAQTALSLKDKLSAIKAGIIQTNRV